MSETALPLSQTVDGGFIARLAEHRMWIAPVGVYSLEGYMICRRRINNVDLHSTKIEYLDPDAAKWVKPFKEQCRFDSLNAAMSAADFWIRNYATR